MPAMIIQTPGCPSFTNFNNQPLGPALASV